MQNGKRMNRCQEIERSIIKKYRKQIWSKFVQSIQEFEMIEENDKIAVCISGGKDSMLLAKCMQELKRHSDTNFEVIYIVMNPGYNKINLEKIKQNAEIMEIPIEIFESNIFNVVSDIKENPCYLCARMRRGYLYEYALKRGCNKNIVILTRDKSYLKNKVHSVATSLIKRKYREYPNLVKSIESL